MGLFKGLKDMADMVNAAPDMIASAYEMADQAKAMQPPAAPAAAEPAAQNLVPINGVDLELYARVSKGIAAYGYDAALLPTVAASLGVAAGDWAAAQSGWATRIQTDSGVGARFNQLYATV